MAFGVTNRRTGILTPVVPDSTPDQASDPTLGLDRIASLSPIRLQVRPGAKTSSSNIDPIHHCAYTHIQAQTQKQTLNTTTLGDKRQPSTFYSGPRHRPRSFPAEPKLRRPTIFAQTFSPRQVETFSLSLAVSPIQTPSYHTRPVVQAPKLLELPPTSNSKNLVFHSIKPNHTARASREIVQIWAHCVFLLHRLHSLGNPHRPGSHHALPREVRPSLW